MREKTIHRTGFLAASYLALCLSAHGQGSVGITLGTVEGDPDGAPIAVTVAPGSPAAQAGIEPGDRIVKLGSVALATFALSDAESLLDHPDQAVKTITVQKRFAQDLTVVQVNFTSAAPAADETPAVPGNDGGIAHWTDDAPGAAAPPAGEAAPLSIEAQAQRDAEVNAKVMADIMSHQQDPSWQPGYNAPQVNSGDVQQENPAPPATKKQKFMNFLNGMANAAAAASGTSVTGNWVSYDITIRRVDAMYIAPLTFTAQLQLNADGTYIYQVQQSEDMPWTMTVQGTYGSSPMGGNVMELDLTPSASNAEQIPGENLSVLAYAGFPVAAQQSFTFTIDPKGAALQPYPRPRSSTQVYFTRAF